MKFMSRIVVMEKIVNTEEKLCQKWMFRNLQEKRYFALFKICIDTFESVRSARALPGKGRATASTSVKVEVWR